MKGLKETLGVAGFGVGLGTLGTAFDSEGLKAGGTAAVGFINPMVNISMGGNVIKMIKDIKPKK